VTAEIACRNVEYLRMKLGAMDVGMIFVAGFPVVTVERKLRADRARVLNGWLLQCLKPVTSGLA
jgi:hypothetical protein